MTRFTKITGAALSVILFSTTYTRFNDFAYLDIIENNTDRDVKVWSNVVAGDAQNRIDTPKNKEIWERCNQGNRCFILKPGKKIKLSFWVIPFDTWKIGNEYQRIYIDNDELYETESRNILLFEGVDPTYSQHGKRYGLRLSPGKRKLFFFD